MSHESAAAFGKNIGGRHTGLLTDNAYRMNDIICILLQRVVHAGSTVVPHSRIIDSQPTPDVKRTERQPTRFEIRINSRCLDDSRFQTANIGDLTPKMKMEQLYTLLHSTISQPLDTGQQLGHTQAEFGFVPASRLPVPGTSGRKLDPYAQFGLNPQTVPYIDRQLKFGRFLNDDMNIQA